MITLKHLTDGKYAEGISAVYSTVSDASTGDVFGVQCTIYNQSRMTSTSLLLNQGQCLDIGFEVLGEKP